MPDSVLVDTDVLIDFASGIHDAIECLKEIEERVEPAISAITHMELLVGCKNKADARCLARMLDRFGILKLTEAISDQAIALLSRYHLSHGLAMADALIAATALSAGIPFVSKNQRDFRFIENLDLLSYPHFSFPK